MRAMGVSKRCLHALGKASDDYRQFSTTRLINSFHSFVIIVATVRDNLIFRLI